MAMASPTPMGSSHFGSLSRRPSARQLYRQPAPRVQQTRQVPVPAETHARKYSLNDSSDDEIQVPVMRFSALTNALLNDPIPSIERPSPRISRVTPELESNGVYQFTAGNASINQETISPPVPKVHSPYPRRVVRLSGTPGSSTLRRARSTSAAPQEVESVRQESPLDLSTPAQMPRTVRLTRNPSDNGRSGGSSGGHSRSGSASELRNDDGFGYQEYPTTVARSQFAASQGSVSRYGQSTVGRTRYGEDAALQGSMRLDRVRKVAGGFMKGPARRGKRRVSEDEQSAPEDQGNAFDSAPSSQEPQSQASEAPSSQEKYAGSSQDAQNIGSLYAPSQRDYAYESPINSKGQIDSVLRSKSPPPPTLSDALRRSTSSAQSSVAAKPAHPVFKVPAPRPDLPSSHDQENEAPPTFKRNKQAPLIHLDKLEKPSIQPVSAKMDAPRIASPERQALAPRNQNTPHRPAPPPPKMSILDVATSTAGATANNASKKRTTLKVNGKYFTRLDVIGRGGSSRVYRVMAENSRMLALKRVSLDNADETTVRGFKGEIDLLKKLKGVDRVISLIDYELNEDKGTLSVLMEMGELDMNKILELRVKAENAKFDASFVRHYWKEMLECLQTIHEYDIVHSDLKPHNFVLVQGRLKLIDFGIANAIQTDETVNVHRDTQIGTPNYMSPESLMDSNAKPPDARGRISNQPKLMKLGKPSDIWSLGCILYQMVYGRAPFAHISNPMQRCQAIINFNYDIEYPSSGVGNIPVPYALIKTMKKCLNRDQFQRPTASDLLDEKDPFLNPPEYDESALPITEDLLGRILMNAMAKCKDRTPSEAELLKLWPQGYFERLRKNMAEGKAL